MYLAVMMQTGAPTGMTGWGDGLARVIEFGPIEALTFTVPFVEGAVAGLRHSVRIVPHFDELVVEVEKETHTVALGNTERILAELARGNSVETVVVITLPGSVETLEIRITWVGSKLAGGSKASTLKLLEDTTYQLVGAPVFRGLLDSDKSSLIERLERFASSEDAEFVIAQVCELSGRGDFEWTTKNWYTGGLAM